MSGVGSGTYVTMVVIFIVCGFIVFFGNPERREQTRNTKPRDYIIAGLVILGLIVTWRVMADTADIDRKQMLRQQFALPGEVELIDFKFVHGGKNRKLHRTRATYRFTDRQLQDYRAKLDDPAVWYPQVFEQAGYVMTGTYTFEARRWNDFPRPLRAADMAGRSHIDELPWLYSLWWKQDWERLKNGRIMCYLFEDVLDNPPALLGREEEYRVSACSELPKTTRIRTWVLAILDFDRKTLSISID